jgi:hypothetical protein
MSPNPNRTSICFRFTAGLPIRFQYAGHRWTIGISHYPKGKVAVVVLKDGLRQGFFAGGRQIERALGLGIEVPLGTVHHRLVCVMIERGLARLVDPREHDLEPGDLF